MYLCTDGEKLLEKCKTIWMKTLMLYLYYELMRNIEQHERKEIFDS